MSRGWSVLLLVLLFFMTGMLRLPAQTTIRSDEDLTGEKLKEVLLNICERNPSGLRLKLYDQLADTIRKKDVKTGQQSVGEQTGINFENKYSIVPSSSRFHHKLEPFLQQYRKFLRGVQQIEYKEEGERIYEQFAASIEALPFGRLPVPFLQTKSEYFPFEVLDVRLTNPYVSFSEEVRFDVQVVVQTTQEIEDAGNMRLFVNSKSGKNLLLETLQLRPRKVSGKVSAGQQLIMEDDIALDTILLVTKFDIGGFPGTEEKQQHKLAEFDPRHYYGKAIELQKKLLQELTGMPEEEALLIVVNYQAQIIQGYLKSAPQKIPFSAKQVEAQPIELRSCYVTPAVLSSSGKLSTQLCLQVIATEELDENKKLNIRLNLKDGRGILVDTIDVRKPWALAGKVIRQGQEFLLQDTLYSLDRIVDLHAVEVIIQP